MTFMRTNDYIYRTFSGTFVIVLDFRRKIFQQTDAGTSELCK